MKAEAFELVAGLEIHVQLLTETKMFSAEPFEYGAPPNTLVSPVSLGLPGALPVLNSRAVELAVRLGLALNCTIREKNLFARKNYFYADLPKGYQITQSDTPIAFNGYLEILGADGQPVRIGIERIHLEEDAGKSLHDQDPYETLIDFNRCGAPLVEIVSRPDIRHPREAYNYVAKIRHIVRWLGVSDGNMEEGSLRCDANISVRPRGARELGTRVEVKNMNSFRHVARAIEYEYERQVQLLMSGGSVQYETRTFDAVQGITLPMRTKEEAHDYRYFPEPDLPPLIVSKAFVEEQKRRMGALPDQLKAQWKVQYQLTDYECERLTEERPMAEYFEQLACLTTGKDAANWLLGPVSQWLNEHGYGISQFPLTSDQLAEVIALVKAEKVSHSQAASVLLPALCKGEGKEKKPEQLARSLGILIEHMDEQTLRHLVASVLNENPQKVAEYRNGKKGLTGFFMGELMKKTQGKVNPRQAGIILNELLNS
ncbi:MAG: Asp-tRNA(Asn)/Glu-tRNA(Gln) amidotransferase subunit GatB [Flavobacteriales bacterium]|nr:Asp-tRNA(Asn)/Glu-tRNA(Gln) amidotransferase subunit GatB [Flavobacteriales bacterium]MCX7767811.1 Asp-tRNA(Asn)/Glu-tRNA(Gln) amidotransferase subunit GatB [Flavobacteriales bacterium]MDW8409788.1 Asp-tRNA(Asn)/Glu-tRNA(Gln) amidotransferase subunit GatB [Flavobacteriales bacterium]